VRPVMENENLGPARDKIHDLFMEHVMAQAPGYRKLMDWVGVPIMPTPGAVGNIIQTIAKQEKLDVIGVDIGSFRIEEDLGHWVNDGLMALFFFVIGLEIKIELVEGQLRTARAAALPAIAALGGMVIPATLFTIINLGGERPVRLDAMLEAVAAAIDCTPVIRRAPMQPGDVTRTAADLTRARDLLGYAPAVPFEDGLNRFARWLEEA